MISLWVEWETLAERNDRYSRTMAQEAAWVFEG